MLTNKSQSVQPFRMCRDVLTGDAQEFCTQTGMPRAQSDMAGRGAGRARPARGVSP